MVAAFPISAYNNRASISHIWRCADSKLIMHKQPVQQDLASPPNPPPPDLPPRRQNTASTSAILLAYAGEPTACN